MPDRRMSARSKELQTKLPAEHLYVAYIYTVFTYIYIIFFTNIQHSLSIGAISPWFLMLYYITLYYIFDRVQFETKDIPT
jgi:hypothetical protein